MTDDMNPGIKKTVLWLNKKGWPTCDSGDGATHDHDCDRDHAYVVIRLPDYRAPRLVDEVEALASELRVAGIRIEGLGPNGLYDGTVYLQGSYSTDGHAFIDIQGLTDAMLFKTDASDT